MIGELHRMHRMHQEGHDAIEVQPALFLHRERRRRCDELMSHCRICSGKTFPVLDLGLQPLANALPESAFETIHRHELRLLTCETCATGQLSFCADERRLYRDYLYMTPDSSKLRAHYRDLVGFLVEHGHWVPSPQVLEIGSNVGRFLEYLKPVSKSILGIDPAANVCNVAIQRGIPTIHQFFNEESAHDILMHSGKKDLIVARHCFAHTPKPWRILAGAESLLADNGVMVIENAYFLDTIRNREFDQIYHEHMYYYTVRSIVRILQETGLRLVDVLHSPIHGGTMAYVIKRKSCKEHRHPRVDSYLEREKKMLTADYYQGFVMSVERNKNDLVALLRRLLNAGRTVHAYGASAKATTLMNYYGINKHLVPYVVDSYTTKHGKLLPLAGVRVISEAAARRQPPDYYLLTIWNYKDEIIQKVRSWGNTKTKFILPHPRVEIVA